MKQTILALLLLFIQSCGGAETSPNCASTVSPEKMCSDFDLDVQKIWNSEIRAKVTMSLGGAEGELGRRKAEQVSTKMDQLTRTWVMLKVSACNDYYKRCIISTDEYKQKTQCFDRFLQQQRELLNAIQAGNSDAIEPLIDSENGAEICN